mgnify:CR=1 FL=1
MIDNQTNQELNQLLSTTNQQSTPQSTPQSNPLNPLENTLSPISAGELVPPSQNQSIVTIQLTSSEIASLWLTYVNDSMAMCVISKFLTEVIDTDAKRVLEQAHRLSESHLNIVAQILKEEGHETPRGFGEEDVWINSPRLYFDSFFIMYMQNMASIGMTFYSTVLSDAYRQDVRNLYTEALKTSVDLHNMATEVMAGKGILTRSPYYTSYFKSSFVRHEDTFFSSIFGKKQPLLSFEVGKLFNNIQKNIVGEALLLGFSQVAQSEEVRKYMVKGKDISKDHITTMTSILNIENLPTSMVSDFLPTTSTIPPFSDKLMMFHTTSLIAIGAANYGVAMSTSVRNDLHIAYTRMITEIGAYAIEGAKIMIKNGWLEQPPQTADRTELSKRS